MHFGGTDSVSEVEGGGTGTNDSFLGLKYLICFQSRSRIFYKEADGLSVKDLIYPKYEEQKA